ncbi:M48 family metalloprotease [Heliobacterium mobile]|uniref:M48 family metalloprotease n=1 Tax=Heliobacterium mobile TaxID=28064 RepID=UPI001A9B2606|nr:M48 family metalloprotease [Heliobacterium mobile]
MKQKQLVGLRSTEYEHPFDRNALEALRGTPGLETIVKKFNHYGIEKLLKIRYTGSNIKVDDRNYPELYDTLRQVCAIIDLPEIPDLYIQWGYEINAFTAGVEKPIIVLNSSCIDFLSKEELMFIIGHEAGHIKSQHVLYHQIAEVLPIMGDIIGNATLGIGSLISTGAEIALLNWQRMSEFTADRAGLLACQDANIATKAMVKLAGVPQKYFNSINVEEFIAQAKEFEGYDYDTLDKIVKLMSTMWMSHPWTVMRGAEFFKWIDTGEYDRLLSANRLENLIGNSNASGTGKMACPNCGATLKGVEKFCPYCGNKI